ncbi:hypothetical protein RvY_05050 [Ramazzottius varieornatus]|uniref:Transmembrane protein 245 n=1 Tax=Ramazzottius varieornatus TaxID=947166 RepID=A0A1D1UTT3_RAMVA|nr:hypothetical protein RvY_05050 [Ramazzottius varieornatus]
MSSTNRSTAARTKSAVTSGNDVSGTPDSRTDFAFRIAGFTAAAHCCLGLLFVAGYEVYLVLETFVQPLVWALLTGTFLYPFKLFLVEVVKDFLRGLQTTSTPILLGIALIPFKLLDKGLDYVGAELVDFFRNYGKKLLYTVLGIAAYFLLYFWLTPYLGFVGTLFKFILGTATAISTHIVWLIIIPYVVALHLLWTSSPMYRIQLAIAAIPFWVLIGFYVYYVLGDLGLPVLLFAVLTVAIGYFSAAKGKATAIDKNESVMSNGTATSTTVKRAVVVEDDTTRLRPTPIVPAGNLDEAECNSPRPISPSRNRAELMSLFTGHYNSVETILKSSYRNVAEVLADEALTTPTSHSDTGDMEIILSKLKELGITANSSEGTRYLVYVFWMFVLLEALTSYYIIPLLVLPVTYRVIKVQLRKPPIQNTVKARISELKAQLRPWVGDRAEVVAPAFVRSLLTYARLGDRKILSAIEGLTDETVSALLIVLMFVVAFTGGVITMFQVEQETRYLVGASGKVFDDVLEAHPEFYEWLPEAKDLKEHFQTGLNSAYVYARDWTIGAVRSTISDTNGTRVAEIETNLVTIADRFYEYYVAYNSTTDHNGSVAEEKGLVPFRSLVSSESLKWLAGEGSNQNLVMSLLGGGAGNSSQLSFGDFDFQAITQFLDFGQIQLFMKTHIDTFTSVLQSVWVVLKGNITLIMSLFTTLVSVAVTYFSAFLNFILRTVVYLTTLFYLLSSSGKRYRPVELISSASRYYAGADAFASIVEDSVSGIFAVSLKIGIFYGFYTWILFTFCGIYVRFIPSVLAALFAVCPILPSYVVCIPVALDLWIRGHYVTMVILCAGAYLPKLFVDAAIYGDVKAANPFIFGLSVAGGLVTLGIEGAVIGPMMLCFLIIVVECFKLGMSRWLSQDNSVQV